MSNEAPAEKPAAVLNAEASVIGGLFIASEMLPAVMAIIDAGDFFADRNARIFRAIVSLIEAGEIVDAVTLPARLHERGDFERVGGTKYLSHIMDAVPTASNIEYHARVVAKHSARRRLRAAAEAIQALASSGDMDADELRAEAERLIAEASPGRAGGGLTPIADLLPDFLRHLEEMTDPHAPEAGVRTGIRSVDDRLGPMNPGQLILVAGRPSMGKTAFGVGNVAMHAALEQGKRVAIFSVETDPAGMMSRIMAAEGSVNMTRARKRRAFGDDEYPRMAHAAGRLRAAPVFLDHTPGLTVDQMRARLRKAEAQSGAMDLIVVDYLQLMSHPRAKSRYEEVSNIGMGLKRIASEFGAAVLALAQLSRAVEQRPDKRPLMSDLRESGTLEQDADAILLLYRPEYYHGATMTVGRGKEAKEVNVEGKAQIILGKVRDGETGTAVVAFEGEYTRFRDLSTREEFAR